MYSTKEKLQNHQSILKIREVFNVTNLCSFHEVTEDEIRKEISKLFCLVCQRTCIYKLDKDCIRIMYTPIEIFMESKLSKLLKGYKKNHNN